VLILLAVVVVGVVVVAAVFGRGSGTFRTAQSAKRVATILVLGSLILLAVGATQFRFLHQSASSGTVVLALDVSASMSRDDVLPTRMQAAKAAARQFLSDLPSDVAVGLVVFSGQAQTLAQPTTDRSTIDDALVGLPRGDGTALGDGLDTAISTIEQRWAADGHGPAAVVLLSDGRDTGSTVTPDAAATRAANAEVPVYTVVLGKDLTDPGSGANIELMSHIADTTDGDAFTATTANGLLAVYRTIQDRLAVALAITDFGAWFVGAAALLAVAGTIAILVALRAEASSGTTRKRPPVRRDVPRSRPRRTDRGRAARPRR
jgi:Ca-activated chloride channel family protein